MNLLPLQSTCIMPQDYVTVRYPEPDGRVFSALVGAVVGDAVYVYFEPADEWFPIPKFVPRSWIDLSIPIIDEFP